MREVERIEEQLRRSFEGEAWHGPSVMEALSGLSPEEAAAHPIAGAHSIWELVLHLGGTYRLVLRRLGGDGRQMRGEEDWPQTPAPTEASWKEAVEALRGLNAQLRQAMSRFPGERLDEPLVPEAPYTAYTQLIGLTQHDLYHAGQVVLLRRALHAGRSSGASRGSGTAKMDLACAMVFVKDLKAMITFYGEVLGLRRIDDGSVEGWAEFGSGGVRLALHAIPPDIAQGIELGDPPMAREEAATKLVFRVADVAAERERLLGRGARMSELRPWGACDGVDPEGNVFQIAKGSAGD